MTLPTFLCLTFAGISVTLATLIVARYWKLRRLLIGLAWRYLNSKKRNPGEIVADLGQALANQQSQSKSLMVELEALSENSTATLETRITGPLGDAITTLQSKLVAMKEIEAKQNWVVQGLAAVSGIRRGDTSLEEYAFQVIRYIVKYIDANQGALYYVESNHDLKRLAAYAYGERKNSDQDLIVASGCGLLGQSVLDKDIIYMTDIPRDYVKITSGLGEATPRCIAMVPLIDREQVFGVFEVACFEPLDSSHMEFLKKSSERIASEMANIEVQQRTSKLLEQAQSQAHQLSSHEEELRQSLEEMVATQEEMKRKEIALEEKLEEIESERAKNEAILESCADGVVSFSDQGAIVYSNPAARDMLGYVKEDMFNQTIEGLLGILIQSGKDGRPVLRSKAGNEITSRTEVNSSDRLGNDISLLITPAHAKVKGRSLFTLFAQKISVDLF